MVHVTFQLINLDEVKAVFSLFSRKLFFSTRQDCCYRVGDCKSAFQVPAIRVVSKDRASTTARIAVEIQSDLSLHVSISHAGTISFRFKVTTLAFEILAMKWLR